MNYRRELIKLVEYVIKNELPHEKSWVYAKKLRRRLFLENIKFEYRGITETFIGMVEDGKSNEEIFDWVRNENVQYSAEALQTSLGLIRKIFE